MRKAYEFLDRLRCIGILRGYGIVMNLQWILGRYWYGQRVIPRARRYYGISFQTGLGVTHGDLTMWGRTYSYGRLTGYII